jgi:hypothetical protein
MSFATGFPNDFVPVCVPESDERRGYEVFSCTGTGMKSES